MKSFLAASVLLAVAGSAQAQLTVYGLTNNSRLVSFSSDAPGTILSNVAITGLDSSELALGIDARPASVTGQLIIITSNNRLLTLGADGVATPIGTGFAPALATQTLGIDFNPTVDRVRVVHSDGSNRRLNPVTGGNAANDAGLTYNDGSGLTPRAVGTAYNTFQFGVGAPVGSVRQYIIDSARDILGEVGSQAGGNASFNGGVVTPVGAGLGFNLSDNAGFDVFGPTQSAFVSSLGESGVASFYSLNLGTGSATPIGDIGGGAAVIDIAVVPTPGAASIVGLMGLAALRRRRA